MSDARRGPMGLGGSAVRGGAVTAVGQWVRFLMQFASLAVLARLLGPDVFGQVAMVMSVVGIAVVLGDFGLSMAAIQSKILTRRERSSLFWWNTLLGLVCSALVMLSAPWIASFFDSAELLQATRWISLVFLLNGLAVQFRAELTREMRFRALAIADVGAQAAGLIVALGIALVRRDIYVLVGQQVSAALFALVILAVAARWWPESPRAMVSVRRFAGFSLTTTGTQVINYLSANAASIVIGRQWGAPALGIYSRMFQLFMFPLQQLASPMTRIALPVLVRASAGNRFLEFLERAQLVLTYALLPLLAVLAGYSEPLITLVLGKRWVDGAPILEILAVGGVFQVLGYVYYWAFLARARMGILLVCEGIGRTVTIILVLLLSRHGLLWVTAGYSFGLAFTWLITSIVGMPRIGVSSARLCSVSARPLAFSVLIWLLCRCLRAVPGFDDWALGAQFGALAAAALVLVGGMRLMLPKFRADLGLLEATIRSSIR